LFPPRSLIPRPAVSFPCTTTSSWDGVGVCRIGAACAADSLDPRGFANLGNRCDGEGDFA
jgi:hypothetical protein